MIRLLGLSVLEGVRKKKTKEKCLKYDLKQNVHASSSRSYICLLDLSVLERVRKKIRKRNV